MDKLGRSKRVNNWPIDYRIRYKVPGWNPLLKERFFTSTSVEAALRQFQYMVESGKVNTKSVLEEIHRWDRFSQGWTKAQ